MSYQKQNFVDRQILYSDELNAMDNQISENEGDIDNINERVAALEAIDYTDTFKTFTDGIATNSDNIKKINENIKANLTDKNFPTEISNIKKELVKMNQISQV